MRGVIAEFIKSITLYDYILFGSLFFLFIVLIIIGIIIRRRTIIAVLTIVFAFVQLIVGSTYGYTKLHAYIYKNEIEITTQKKLNFTQAIVIEGVLKNTSEKDFQSCKIEAKVCKKSKYKIKEFILGLKPVSKMFIIEENIPKAAQREFKMIVEPFTYPHDYNVTVKAKCK